MKNYTFYWLNGKSEKAEGNSLADAFRRAGYGLGALDALDFYSESDDDYEWDKTVREWKKQDKQYV